MSTHQKVKENRDDSVAVPKLKEFADLLAITRFQLVTTLALPFVCTALYFICAFSGWWIPAVLSVMILSFITYGSTSHDLVHRNLGLSSSVNNIFLSVIELLALRSGHAYRAAHLHHHARYPQPDDIEGAAARMSFGKALLEGVGYNLKLYRWAFKHSKHDRIWIKVEGIVCVLLIIAAVGFSLYTPIFAIYAALMIMGSWILPLMTSYLPHDPQGENPLFQTRLFRGRIASLIAMEHLYHLEHHLYPAIPHHNWAKLAQRLDPFFKKKEVRPIKFWF